MTDFAMEINGWLTTAENKAKANGIDPWTLDGYVDLFKLCTAAFQAETYDKDIADAYGVAMAKLSGSLNRLHW